MDVAVNFTAWKVVAAKIIKMLEWQAYVTNKSRHCLAISGLTLNFAAYRHPADGR